MVHMLHCCDAFASFHLFWPSGEADQQHRELKLRGSKAGALTQEWGGVPGSSHASLRRTGLIVEAA
jgi:hypothetical protein